MAEWVGLWEITETYHRKTANVRLRFANRTFDWFKSKQGQQNEPPVQQANLEVLTKFIAEYNSSNEKAIYAMHLWGRFANLNKIFGNLKGFQSADSESKNKYITIISTDAISNLRDGNLASASCANFYVNYLVAISNTPRNELRGPIEQIADIVDGIVRHGENEMKRVGKIEEDTQTYLQSQESYKIGSGIIRGSVTERTALELSAIILRDLQQVLQTNEDYYWFVLELHGRLISKKDFVRTIIDGQPLLPFEYEGRHSISSYVGKPNPGIQYIDSIYPSVRNWCQKTVPMNHPDEISTRLIAAAYTRFRMENESAINQIRLEHAVHFHNNCISNGHFESAERWGDVIDALS